MCEQGVTGDVFVGCYYLLGADPLPSGAALIRGQAESRLLCFLPCFSGFGAPRCKREGGREGWWWGGLRKNSRTDTCLWFKEIHRRTTGRWEWVTFLWPSVPPSFHLATGGCPVGEPPPPPPHFFFQLPSNHSDMASHLPCIKNSSESNLTLSNGGRFEFPLWDTGTSWETTTI